MQTEIRGGNGMDEPDGNKLREMALKLTTKERLL